MTCRSPVWAAPANCRGLGGPNDRRLFLMVLKADEAKIKVQADSVSGESQLAGSPHVLT